jgi:hypothetical protein
MNNDIEEIKRRINILDVCSKAGIAVIKRGSSYWIHSIYHTERTPSLQIKHDGNYFVDFSWSDPDEGRGDVIQFWQDLYRMGKGKEAQHKAIEELKIVTGIVSGGADKPEWRQHTPTPLSRGENAESDITVCMSRDEKAFYMNEKRGFIEAKRKIQQYRLEKNKEIFEELGNYSMRAENKCDKAFVYLEKHRMIPADSIAANYLFAFENYSKVNNHLKKEFDLERLQLSGLFNVKCKQCKRPHPLPLSLSRERGIKCECGSVESDGNLIFYMHKIIIPYVYQARLVYLRGRYFNSDQPTPWELPDGAERACKYIGLRDDLLRVNTTRRFYNLGVLKRMLPGERLYIVEGEFDCIVMNSRRVGLDCIAIPGAGNIPDPGAFEKYGLDKYEIHIIPDNDSAGAKFVERLTEIFHGMDEPVVVHDIGSKDVTEFVVDQLRFL